MLRIDPATGGQTTIASGAPFSNPLGVAIEASGNLIVTDGFGGESILHVDPALGTIAVLSTGLPYLSDPAGVGLAVSSTGDIYVADFGALAVIRVDPVTGTQTLVSVGGMFVRPTGLAIEADGDLIVVDRDAQGGNGAVIRVDPTTGAQSVVSSGGNFSQTAGIAVDGDGDLIVVDFGSDTVIRVNPTTGARDVRAARDHGSRRPWPPAAEALRVATRCSPSATNYPRRNPRIRTDDVVAWCGVIRGGVVAAW